MAVKKKSKAKSEIAEWQANAEERYAYAKAIKEIQDEPTQVAINRMVAVMDRMAPVQLDEAKRRIRYYNHTWIAVRMLVACAEWDIRIANFKAPKKSCLRCGKKVK